MKKFTLAIAVSVIFANCTFAQESSSAEAKQETAAALNFTMQTIEGKEKALGDYQGDVVVIVNVASKCGLTKQYTQLQQLHEKYSEKGLSVLGFPCNQFGGQEPGTDEEIKTFCVSKYDVEFDMFSKIDVNGEDNCALYKHLNALETNPKGAGDITWNFEKYLLDREGNVIGRFGPQTDPMGDKFVGAIESALEKK